MKNLYKFLLALAVQISVFAQIAEITRLPVQDILQSIKESAPVWLSENEIMIFYVNQTKDTIFSTRSTNQGQAWSPPKFQFKVELLQQTQELIYPSVLKTKSGRLIFAWSVLNEGINFSYSDDNGNTWSSTQVIFGISPSNPFMMNFHYIKITQLADESLTLCFNPANDQGTLYYKESTDDGQTWSETAKRVVTGGGYRYDDHTIISISQSTLIAVFKYRRTLTSPYHIGARYSYDNGVSWGDTVNLSGYNGNQVMPRISKDNSGNLWLSYLRNTTIIFEQSHTFVVGDIYYRRSTDGGTTWAGAVQFTKFIGDDNFVSLTSVGSAPFITYSTVKFTGNHQVSFGVLGETAETYTPPSLFDAYSPYSYYLIPDPNHEVYTIRAFIKDDNQVESVKVFFEDPNEIFELYDDGLHNDLEANDGVYANIFEYNPSQPSGFFLCAVNKLKIPFSNNGLVADVMTTEIRTTNFLVNDTDGNALNTLKAVQISIGPTGKFEESSFLFSAGFFLSGYTNNTLWSNAVASASLVEDYLTGTVNSNPNDPLFNFYVVKKDDIPFGSSWQRWKDAVSLGAEFYDGDGDGIYNPVDKNWNGTWDLNEDMPPLIGDEIAWCVYNDGFPANQRRWQSEPQGIEVRQTIFATNDPGLENVIFIRYSFLNTGMVANTMDSVYFGIWEDGDLGDATDDVVGCDTLLQSGFYYSTVPDAQYGVNPPSFFTSLLQGPIINTNNSADTAYIFSGELIGRENFIGAKNLKMASSVFNIGGSVQAGDPNSAIEARNYLEGKTRFESYPDPCTFPFCEVRGGVNCNEVNPCYWASGDPVTNVGWIDKENSDHRNLVSTGPFQLEKDKPQQIIIAYVIGRGNDPLNSVTVARENVQRAIQEYQSNFTSMTYTPPAPTNPVNSYVLYQNYPNPFNPNTTIRYELPQDGIVTIEVFDILGQKVKTILNEFKRADRYEVTFSAKGGSASGGSSTGLASGVYIYQIRVNEFIESKKMVLIR